MSRKSSTVRAHQIKVPYRTFEKGVNDSNVKMAILYSSNTIVDLLLDVRANQRTIGRTLEEMAKKQGITLPDDAKFPEVYKAEEHEDDGTKKVEE